MQFCPLVLINHTRQSIFNFLYTSSLVTGTGTWVWWLLWLRICPPYDSGTCPHDLLSITVKGLAAMRVPSLSLPRPCAITQFQTETFWRNRLSPERLRGVYTISCYCKKPWLLFCHLLSWYLKNKVPPIAISKTDPTTINVFIFFCFIHEPFPKFCFHRQR